MKKNEVKIGGEYIAKVSDKLTTVRITGESRYGGWDAVNQTTGKKVRIKSAAKLRGKAIKPGKKHAEAGLVEAAKGLQVGGTPVYTPAQDTPAEACTEAPGDDGGPGGEETAEPKAKATKTTGRPTGQHGATGEKRQSLLDVAAHLLSLGTGRPMTCGDIVKLAIEKDLWQPQRGGKTPDRTLYSAILREINTKGKDSRFQKAERGKFQLASKS